MIYLDNITSPQEIFIERNDGNGYIHTGSSQSYEEGYADGVNDQKAKLASTAFTENGDYQRNDGWSAITVNVPQSGSVLEGKEIIVSQDVTIVVPTSGYDGFSAVTVDATEYGQTNYDNGFDDGYTDGYSSGSSEGYDSGYTEGYQSGSTDGFNSGYTSGETHQKSLLVSTAITENGSYQRENGYSVITVNVPNTSVLGNGSFTANGYYYASMDNLDGYSMVTVNVPKDEVTWKDLDYEMAFKDITIMPLYYNVDYLRNVHISCNDMVNSARTDGQNDIISTFTAATATTNGVYGSSANPLSSITVNVPQTGHTDQELQDAYDSGYTSGENDVISTFSSITITQNGQYGDSVHPMSSITVNVPTSGGSGYSIDQLAIRDYNINNPTISTTDIKLFAFANSNLSGMLIIGSAVTNIYAYAFSHTNISGITFPQTIVGNEYGKMVMAGSGQFEYCANLTSVNIPSYIEFTDNARARNTYGIFEECRNLVSVNWDADRVPTYCFRYCSSLSAINLTNVTNIDNYSFMNCGSLSSITIPSVCTRIGNGAFGNCSSLNEINVLATTAPTLGVAAFMNTPTGTVHYPQGSDYSSWQSNQYLSGWTFVGDL